MKVRNIVNEEKRTCVVIISDCEYDVIRKVRKTFRSQFGDDFHFIGNVSYLPEKFVGKAKCAPEDVFDAEVGLELARERAYKQYNREYNKELYRVIDQLENAVCRLETFEK